MTTLQDFFAPFPEKSFTKGETLIMAGTPLTHLYYLTDGVGKLIATSESGHSLMLHLFHPGSCLPLLSLVTHNQNHYDALALTDLKVKVAPVDQVVEFIKTNPEVCFDLNQKLLMGLNGLVYRIQQTAFVPAFNQVAGVLVYFAKHFAATLENTTQISIHLTHQDIAEWLGLSRENVSLQMKELENQGLISKHDKLLVLNDLEALKKVAEFK